jgi:MFS family permease
LLICAFLLFFVIYLTGAVWPIYVSERGFQEGFLGLVIGFYGFALFVSRLPIGWFCDILVEKRRFMISGGFLALALGLALPPLVDSAWSLFVSRILMGVGAGSFVAIAVLYTLYFPPRSAKASIVVAASFFGWGQIFANPAGGWLADRFDMLMSFWIAVVISIVAAILVLTIIEPDEEKNPVQRTLLPKSANLYIMAATMAVVFFAIYATVYNVTQLYASNHLQITSTTQGLLLMVFVTVFVGVVLFSPRLDSAFGSTRVITAGLAVLGLGVLLTSVGNLAGLYLAELLTGVGFGLTFGLLMALSVENIPGGQRFFAMGIFQSTYAAGMMLGPMTAGYAAQVFGFSVTFILVGSLTLVAGVLFYVVRTNTTLGQRDEQRQRVSA